MSGFGSSIRIEAAPPRLLACLIRNAGWLNSGFVAVTSRTADAEGIAPSFDMIETVAIVFLRWVGTYARKSSDSATARSGGPCANVATNPARAVYQNDGRQTVRSTRMTETLA